MKLRLLYLLPLLLLAGCGETLPIKSAVNPQGHLTFVTSSYGFMLGTHKHESGEENVSLRFFDVSDLPTKVELYFYNGKDVVEEVISIQEFERRLKNNPTPRRNYAY